jgi:AraC family transcriptional regulator, L-rhamnose operon transcriptional activator RhaR
MYIYSLGYVILLLGYITMLIKIYLKRGSIMSDYPVLKGNKLFRKNEYIYLNRSDELQEYMEIMHKHDFIEIVYVVSGKGIHFVGDTRYETSKGDLFIINFDVAHGFFPREGEADPPTVYNCSFMPEFLDISLFTSSHFEDITASFLFKSLFPDNFTAYPDLTLNSAESHEIGTLFEKMYVEYKNVKKGYNDILRAYLIELIVKIFRYKDEKKNKSPLIKNQELINNAIEYMKTNYNSDITLSELAMQSFISKNYFSKVFKDVTGTNFSDYIQSLRTDKACILLQTTDMKVTDIAFQVGFKDIKFFYEVFKKITGKTPGDFRKS